MRPYCSPYCTLLFPNLRKQILKSLKILFSICFFFKSGGKRATIRTWKRYYTILCGQLLCFFKDEESFMTNSAASAPINILNADCSAYPEYMKKKNAFRCFLSIHKISTF